MYHIISPNLDFCQEIFYMIHKTVTKLEPTCAFISGLVRSGPWLLIKQ